MIDAFYTILLVVFGSLNAFTLVDYLVRRNTLKDELGVLQEQLEMLEQKQGTARGELGDLEFDIDLLEEEQQALQAQESCMQQLEEAQAQAQTQTRNPGEIRKS